MIRILHHYTLGHTFEIYRLKDLVRAHRSTNPDCGYFKALHQIVWNINGYRSLAYDKLRLRSQSTTNNISIKNTTYTVTASDDYKHIPLKIYKVNKTQISKAIFDVRQHKQEKRKKIKQQEQMRNNEYDIN